MNFKSILATAAAIAFVGGSASALTIGVAVDGVGGNAVEEAMDIGAGSFPRAALAAVAGVDDADVIGYYIPLSQQDCTYGIDGCGLMADSASDGTMGIGSMSMFVEFDPVEGSSAQVLSFWFEDLDLINSNDPSGFFEMLTVYDTDSGDELASFVTLGDDGIEVVAGSGTDVILKAQIDLSVPGSTLTAQLDFGVDGFGTNTPEFLVATLEPVPLPAGILMMGTALAGFGVMRRRKKAS